MFCKNCGNQIDDSATVCNFCGAPVSNNSNSSNNTAPVYSSEQKSKMAAGLLGIFLGGFGIHNFYIGNTTRGVIQLVLTLFSCGIASIWGFIEGILILCGSINTDANGVPFKD